MAGEFKSNLKLCSILGLINVGMTLFDSVKDLDVNLWDHGELDFPPFHYEGKGDESHPNYKFVLVWDELRLRGLIVDFALIHADLQTGKSLTLVNAYDAVEKGYAHLGEI